MLIPFGALEKDRAGIDTGLLTIATNCQPNTIGWGPMPSLSGYTVTALPTGCQGLFWARTKSGSYQVYAATAAKLFRLVSGAWVDCTRATGGDYNTLAGNVWQYTQFDGKLIVVNGSDNPQVIDIDAGDTKFRDLGGSPPAARFVWTVGDFVFLADANNRRRFLCSGINNPEHWTIGELLCDEFILPDGGNIAGPGRLGTYGMILQDGGAARRLMPVEGDPNIAWRLEEIQGIRSAIDGYSTLAANGQFFYLAEDGPYGLTIDGGNTPIGSHRISKEFLANCDQARLDQFMGFADPYSSRIYWAYYKTAGSPVFDGLLGYDYLLDRLFFADIEAQFWAPVIVPGTTLEDLDATYPSIDAMTLSLDSRQFQGGRPTIGAITKDGKLALLSGPSLEATLEVAPTQLIQGGRSFVGRVELKGMWGDANPTLMIGKQEFSGDPVRWAGPYSRSSRTGVTHTRASARIHTFRVTIPAGTSWEFAQAMDIAEQPDGQQ